MSDEDRAEQAEARFRFLFPRGKPAKIRFVLHAPDLVELRWSVFDKESKRTIAFGSSPEEAVDVAMIRPMVSYSSIRS